MSTDPGHGIGGRVFPIDLTTHRIRLNGSFQLSRESFEEEGEEGIGGVGTAKKFPSGQNFGPPEISNPSGQSQGDFGAQSSSRPSSRSR